MAQGSIKKRQLAGGRVRWDVVVDLGNDPVTGKRRQRKKTFMTKREAQAVTLGTYAHVLPAQRSEIADRLGALLFTPHAQEVLRP